MAITDWHENDRPREKLLKFGSSSLSDAELLAIFLRVGVKGKSAVELAQDLLDHFGNLHNLFQASETDFCQAKGMGQAKYVQLKAVLEMARRHFESGLKAGQNFASPEAVAQFLSLELGQLEREVFSVILLNQQNQLISFHKLFEGTINQATVHPREIIKLALKENASGLILAHNHPSGNPTPSEADKQITQTIHQACQLMEIRLLDHVILGTQGRWSAFSQLGLLSNGA